MDDAFSVCGKNVLIVGAGSGIGKACAELFAKNGAKVIASGRTLKKLESLKAQFPQIEIFANDFLNQDSSKKFASEIQNIDVLIWTAGISVNSLVKFSDDSELESVMKSNVFAPAFFTKKLLESKKINKGASLVYISSIAGILAQTAFSSYAASKAALSAFVRGLAVELSPRKIRVNAICPALVKTPMTADFLNSNPELASLDEKKYLLGYGEAQDVANSAIFLASEASRWITGTNLIVDGGYSCQK